jgi:hypothetical protein
MIENLGGFREKFIKRNRPKKKKEQIKTKNRNMKKSTYWIKKANPNIN